MRRKTTSVRIGNLILSSEQPVMIQSMLNTPTMDVNACVEQAIRIIEAGGQLVRITVPGEREAERLKEIHAALRARGYDVPLSADIHFTTDVASIAAGYVEKVRINPGNFVKKMAVFENRPYRDYEYSIELDVVRQKFLEFLQVCREHGTAVRVGTNHGSLSERVMLFHGDTVEGMVVSTMEFLTVCRWSHFDDVVVSLKASDCCVMVDAVRLLVAEMEKKGMQYPLHLGVTEAGEGEDGRIRSAVGIGTLLNEGIGDTIRVSLTEEPEAEIPVARALVEICSAPDFEGGGMAMKGDYVKPVIVADLSGVNVVDERVSEALGFTMGQTNDPVFGDRLVAGIKAPELVYTETLGPELTKLPEETVVVVPSEIVDMAHVYNRNAVPLCSVDGYMKGVDGAAFVQITEPEELDEVLAARLRGDEKAMLVLSFDPEYHFYRDMFRRMEKFGVANKAIIQLMLLGEDRERISLVAASQVGGFFLDRLAWGLWISTPGIADVAYSLGLSRNILQSAGSRRYKAEFISCPGCGRTLFDIQGAVAKVKAAFGHLNTLKIAVMGCVVNGPGEMADADYGYVGAGNGKVNLYKGRQMVRGGVPEEEAIEALRDIIEASDGRS